MAEKDINKTTREQRANRTGLFKGLGVIKNPDSATVTDPYIKDEKLPRKVVTGESIARETYGDNFDKFLNDAKNYYINKGNKISEDLHEAIPSYNKKVWQTPIDTYSLKNSVAYGNVELSGLTESTKSGLPKILSLPKALPHESVHGLQMLSSNPKFNLTADEAGEYPLPSFYFTQERNKKDFRPLKSEYLEQYQAGYKAASAVPDETVAYMTDVNRKFYKQNKRRIETPADLEQGFKLLEQAPGLRSFVQKGKADALRNKAEALDLSKMLIQRENGMKKVKGIS